MLTVRLQQKPAGKPVPDAIVFARRLDMAPAGMPTMTTELEPQPATEPGLYRFKTNLTMAGDWQLSLAAKVQGETGTVQNQVALKVVP
ncbi:FixH family protein [Methylobacterium persicinum]